MIRLMVRMGKWLESRFPEKVVVTLRDWHSVQEELTIVRAELKDNTLSLNTALERLSVVESSAVHKGAVSDLVKVVKELKDDHMSFKASMGFKSGAIPNEEIQAMLNGEII